MPAGPAPPESSSPLKLRTGRTVLLLLPLLAAHLGLLAVFDLARHPALTLTLLGAAFLALALISRRLPAVVPGKAILWGALLLRLPLLALPPSLSDDAERYLWDGKVAAAGFNPYALAPAAEELAPLRDEAWRRLPHKEVPAVYPPLAVAAFSIASRFPFPLLVWKGIATGADLAACAFLLALARRLGIPEGRTVWYAWNPLVALEISGMGHVDALGVMAVIATLLFVADRRRAGTAATWAAAGALAKLVPLAAFPLWARRSGRPAWFLAASLGLVAAAALPVLASTGGVPPGLLTYGVSWEFNGPLFEPLWRGLDWLGAAPALAGLLDRLKDWTGEHELWNPLYPYLYPQLLAKALLGIGMLAAVALSLKEEDPVAGTERLFGRLLLCSATVYPWYLLWVLPLTALTRRIPWLVLSGLILLSYIPQTMGVPLFPWVYLAIWGPFLILLAKEKAAPARALTPQPPLPPLHPPSLGEGEQNGGDAGSPLPGRGKGVAGEGLGVRAREGERSRREDAPP